MRSFFQKVFSYLLWVWQLPQHLVGLFLIWVLKAERREHNGITYWHYEQTSKFAEFLSGGSLGMYILLPDRSDLDQTVPHEFGHSIQSAVLGPLYLIIIGISSAVFNNLWDRAFHKNWTYEQRIKWYYNRFPEKSADKLGGVVRVFK